MSIPCKLVTVALPQNPEDKTYVRLQSVSRGTYGFDQMAEDINHQTSLTEADAMAAVTAFMSNMRTALLAGKIVELEGIGRFRVIVKSDIVKRTESERRGFRPFGLLRGFRIQFLPTVRLKAFLAKGIELVEC